MRSEHIMLRKVNYDGFISANSALIYAYEFVCLFAYLFWKRETTWSWVGKEMEGDLGEIGVGKRIWSKYVVWNSQNVNLKKCKSP